MTKILSKREVNKIKKREILINTAEIVFMEKGFENASIDEIAKKSNLTKRTLYQYFMSKEDLFYAVVLKGFSFLILSFEKEMKKDCDVLTKIHAMNSIYLHFYMDNKAMFQLLNYKPSNQNNVNNSQYYKELEILDKKRISFYIDLVNESKLDDSINTNLETKKAIYFAFFTSYSLLSMVSTTTNFWEMLGFTEKEFLSFSFDLISNALK